MKFYIPKMIVRAESNEEDLINKLRAGLTGDQPLAVDENGTINPDGKNSTQNGEGVKTIPKTTVAVPDSPAGDEEDLINKLRAGLTGDQPLAVDENGTINPDGKNSAQNGEGVKTIPKTTVAVPDSPAGDEEDLINKLRAGLTGDQPLAVDENGTINPDGKNSAQNGEGVKTIPKTTVAMPDNNSSTMSSSQEEDLINKLRAGLTGDQPLAVDETGTIHTDRKDSTNGGQGVKTIPKTTVAAQWYQEKPDLFKAELVAMNDINKGARYGFLNNGKMYWTVQVSPNVAGRTRRWTLLMVYDSDHPQARWGGSVKVYPVQPDINEMKALVQQHRYSNVAIQENSSIPHLLSDENNKLYMCTADYHDIETGANNRTTSAATCLRYAIRWINVFELGLRDPKTWRLFHEHGKI